MLKQSRADKKPSAVAWKIPHLCSQRLVAAVQKYLLKSAVIFDNKCFFLKRRVKKHSVPLPFAVFFRNIPLVGQEYKRWSRETSSHQIQAVLVFLLPGGLIILPCSAPAQSTGCQLNSV